MRKVNRCVSLSVNANRDLSTEEYHRKDPKRGAGTRVELVLLLELFARQHRPEVQFASLPVEYPVPRAAVR